MGSLPANVRQTWFEIAHELELTLNWVDTHLAIAMAQSEVELGDMIDLDEKTLKVIRFEIELSEGEN